MKINVIYRAILLGALLMPTTASFCQNNGKGLVDSRVTLDDRYPDDSRQDRRPNDRRKGDKKPGNRNGVRPQGPARNFQPADTTPAVVLPSKSSDIEVSATIDTATIVIGQKKTLHVKVTPLNGGKKMPVVQFPSLEALTTGPIEALESTLDTVRDKSGEIKHIEQSVTITSFDAGRHRIGGIAVQTTENGQPVLLGPAEELYVNVVYSADADTTKCEARPDLLPVKEPYTFWEIIRWLLLALLAAALVFAVVWIVKRRKEHKPIVVLPKAKPVPADRKAISELESLRRKELWQKGRVKKYYTDLTDIVRRFLHNMYGISAAEMTTRQTLRAFHNIEDWSDDAGNLLQQLLSKADMVKFAKSQPESHEHDQAMQNAVDFVCKVAETHRINNPENKND